MKKVLRAVDYTVRVNRSDFDLIMERTSLCSWRDFARECFCFGKPAREYGGSAAAHASRQLRRLRQCHQYYESFQLKIIVSKTSADFRCPRLPRRHGSSSRDKERTDYQVEGTLPPDLPLRHLIKIYYLSDVA